MVLSLWEHFAEQQRIDLLSRNQLIKLEIMAKILFGAFLADMRGKVNGTVFSKNRGGAYARTKVTPSNPQTAAQNLVRSRLTGFSQAWRGLAQSARDAWNAAVGSFPRTNVFGQAKILSGHQLYIGLNAQLGAAGQGSITLPPVPVGAAALTAYSGAAADGAATFTVTAAPDPVPADNTLIIDATEQVSAGKSNLNSLYRQIQIEAAASAGPHDIHAAYIAKFGPLIAGQKIGIRGRFVNDITGEVSGAVTAEIIVAA